MSPTHMLLVFRVVVLRLNNQHIGIADELDEFLVLGAGVAERGGGNIPLALSAQALVRLVVGQEDNRPFAGVNPVADTDAGMVGEDRLDLHAADGKL